jgi:hypothetical protein
MKKRTIKRNKPFVTHNIQLDEEKKLNSAKNNDGHKRA